MDDDPQVVRIDGEPMVVVSEDVEGDQTLVLAVPMDEDAETLSTVATLLVIAVPALLLLVAVTTWLVTGRALRPVTRIRQEVEGITPSASITGCRSRHRGRDPLPRRDDERDARPARRGGDRAAPLRVRCFARAPLPPGARSVSTRSSPRRTRR
ncbi:hypothetical protein CTI14_28310 [Methylobacterium radiotolerans]|nr:hypothetical protein CTI14_28310 [Methylobacterium radiotolerans]